MTSVVLGATRIEFYAGFFLTADPTRQRASKLNTLCLINNIRKLACNQKKRRDERALDTMSGSDEFVLGHAEVNVSGLFCPDGNLPSANTILDLGVLQNLKPQSGVEDFIPGRIFVREEMRDVFRTLETNDKKTHDKKTGSLGITWSGEIRRSLSPSTEESTPRREGDILSQDKI